MLLGGNPEDHDAECTVAECTLIVTSFDDYGFGCRVYFVNDGVLQCAITIRALVHCRDVLPLNLLFFIHPIVIVIEKRTPYVSTSKHST
jgi:hypothetical protein